MGYIKSFFYEFKNTYTVDDRLITILFVSIFMPWMISVFTLFAATIYVLTCSNFVETMNRVKGAKVLLAFALYLLVISLCYQNWLGAGISVGMLCMFILVLHYRRYIHRDLLEQVIDIMILLSIVSVVYAIGEQFYYMSQIDGMGFLDIQNKPQWRVHTFFFNANYYAMMILYVEVMCIYKFFRMKDMKWKAFYVVMGLLNLFALFLTGGRIAWLCLALAGLSMVLFNRWFKTFTALVVGCFGAVGVLALKPNLLPRLASQGLAIGRRTKIWETASLIISDSWLFGRGPLTYFHVYESYTKEYIAVYGMKSFKQYKLGISSQHAHSMFIEPIVSFGVVGTILFAWYLGSQVKRIFKLFTRKIDFTLGSLLIGVLVSTITFCIIDFPIYWVQTGLLLLLLLGASDIYAKELV